MLFHYATETGRVPMQSALSGTQKVVLNQKRLRQAHVFTLLLRILIPSNWESSNVVLIRISEEVKAITLYMR